MPNSDLFNYQGLLEKIADTLLAPMQECIPKNLEAEINHGDFPGWMEALKALPQLAPTKVDLKKGVSLVANSQLSDQELEQLQVTLMRLHPWRKGPFDLFGLQINTEWHSDWKWDRVLPHISPLQGRVVLDVGCGNGYHCWRMAGEGASLVVGVDSHLLFNMQYWALRHFLPAPPVYVLPLALEKLPTAMKAFDTVFSMGVLYHNRSPFDHLISLRHQLRAGGELVLETLVIEGEEGLSLVPQGRYSRMPNVWFLPTCATMVQWLEKSGYTEVRVVDVNKTSVEEQRSTDWMQFESLSEALDPHNTNLTIEGHPAPIRAVFIAKKPW